VKVPWEGKKIAKIGLMLKEKMRQYLASPWQGFSTNPAFQLGKTFHSL
jgi:hypothetical protein